MFLIGMGAALFTGQDDIAAIMVQAGMGVAGSRRPLVDSDDDLPRCLFSRRQRQSLVPRFRIRSWLSSPPSWASSGHLRRAGPVQDFLYLIGSVFAPMTAILLSDFFILKQDHTADSVNWLNLVLWVLGVILPLSAQRRYASGITVPVVVILMVISALVHKVLNKA